MSFTALKGREWLDEFQAEETTFNLFGSGDKIETIPAVAFPNFVDVKSADEFTVDQQSGFIKMTLEETTSSLALDAFGHSQYQNLYVLNAISLSKSDSGTLPNEPLTPKTKSLTLDYEATHTLLMSAERAEENLNGHFYHITPFGFKKETKTDLELLPILDFEGAFFMGFENLTPPQNLTVLFQVAEGSENPDKLPPTIKWRYLAMNTWVDFLPEDVLSDGTNGMINSGINQFSLAKSISDNNTVLPSDQFWISGSVASDSDAVCQLIDVHTQAVTAEFENDDNNLSHLGASLPAETIGKLSSSDSSIRKVTQPYGSFDGKLPEEEGNYYRRVSERLRHKNRAITIWDFERLVLETYPDIYKVKCLNHTRMTANYSEQAPGHVSMVVISNLRNQNAVNVLQPTTNLSKLQSINRFLNEIKDPFATVHVKNPYFEEIKVDFKVRFYDAIDAGLYLGKINEDIKQFLSPWAYSEGADIIFEGVIYKSKIINFIEELDYVDYVSCFKMYHVGVSSDDMDEITATKSSAILVSAVSHAVHLLTTDDCECEDDNIQSTTITGGIGAMTVGLDLKFTKT